MEGGGWYKDMLWFIFECFGLVGESGEWGVGGDGDGVESCLKCMVVYCCEVLYFGLLFFGCMVVRERKCEMRCGRWRGGILIIMLE